MNNKGANIYSGRGNIYSGRGFHKYHTVPHASLASSIARFKMQHNIPPGSEVPPHHVFKVLKHGYYNGPAAGGFLPLALLLPLLGKAALALGGSAALGGAAHLGKKAIDGIFGSGVPPKLGFKDPNKYLNDGYADTRAPEYRQMPVHFSHHKGAWTVDGAGFKDVLGKIISKAGGFFGSAAAKKIAHAGKDALIDATIDSLTHKRNTDKEIEGKQKSAAKKKAQKEAAKKKKRVVESDDEDSDDPATAIADLMGETRPPPTKKSRIVAPVTAEHNPYKAAMAAGNGMYRRRYM